MRTVTCVRDYSADPVSVFTCLDSLGITGMHMTKASAMMMGSKLHLEYLTPRHNGLGSRYRWTGRMMGIPMDFTVEVTKWIPNKEKVWETVGTPKLIIYSGYRMELHVSSLAEGAKAVLSISYERPAAWFNKVLSYLLADLYCNWCLKKMLSDAQKSLEKAVTTSL